MTRQISLEYLQLAILPFFGCVLWGLSGCNDVCNVGDSKCEGNRILICEGSDAEKSTNWSQFRDCSKLHATCQSGVYTQYVDFLEYEIRTDHSCVTTEYTCNDYEGYSCTDDNEFVINCSISNGEMVAAIGVDNWDSRPYCIDVGYTSVFAYSKEACETGEIMCDTEGRTLRCVQQTWQWASDICDVGK